MASTKKIAIIGTSNSILKGGWVDGFKQFHPLVSNFSLGASPSLYAQYIMSKHDVLDSYDVVIFDFALNDTFFIQHGTISPHFLVKSFDALLRSFAGQTKCVPIVLNFVNKLMFKEKVYSTYELYNTIAAAHGVPYFSVGSLISKARMPISHPNFFLDDWHIARQTSHVFGEMLGMQVDLASDLWTGQERERGGEVQLAFTTLANAAVRPVKAGLANKKTSLIAYDAYEFEQASRLIVSGAKRLCGTLLCQSPNTSSCLTAVGADGTYRCQKAKAQVASTTFSFQALHTPMESQDALTFLHARHVPNICSEACNVRKSDALNSFALIDALFVENYNADDSLLFPDLLPKAVEALNLTNSISASQYRECAKRILASLAL